MRYVYREGVAQMTEIDSEYFRSRWEDFVQDEDKMSRVIWDAIGRDEDCDEWWNFVRYVIDNVEFNLEDGEGRPPAGMNKFSAKLAQLVWRAVFNKIERDILTDV